MEPGRIMLKVRSDEIECLELVANGGNHLAMKDLATRVNLSSLLRTRSRIIIVSNRRALHPITPTPVKIVDFQSRPRLLHLRCSRFCSILLSRLSVGGFRPQPRKSITILASLPELISIIEPPFLWYCSDIDDELID